MTESELVAAARAGDHDAFTTLTEPHRAGLRLHCYRMLASYDEAEDLVQETLLRAWKAMASFEERASVRTWLYRIATNACLDAAARNRRVLPFDLTGPWDPAQDAPPRTDLPWLQPFPDQLLPTDPGEAVASRETVELAVLAALQVLPARQRAALLARDLLGWSARETADLLGTSVAAANSAVQRARDTLRRELPDRRDLWATQAPSPDELSVMRRYVAALEALDLDAVAALLADDVRAAMPPLPMWYAGRDAVLATLRRSWDAAGPEFVGRLASVPIRANGGPALAMYRQAPGDRDLLPFALGSLRIRSGRITEMVAFHDAHLFEVFELPAVLER